MFWRIYLYQLICQEIKSEGDFEETLSEVGLSEKVNVRPNELSEENSSVSQLQWHLLKNLA